MLNFNKYLQQRKEAIRSLDLSSHVKLMANSRMLVFTDTLDGILKIRGSTCIETLKQFCCTIQNLYKKDYLGLPTLADLVRLGRKAKARGFPGMLGSLDCIH